MSKLRLALAQVNATVGALRGNADKAAQAADRAMEQGADLIVFPEMFLAGYPPEDLLLKPHFVRRCRLELERLAQRIEGITAIMGYPEHDGDVRNSAAILHGGRVAGVYHKVYLPNYGVFDEERYFRSGDELFLLNLDGALIGLSICEDIWYPGEPTRDLALAGAELIINISASPYHAGKGEARHRMLRTRAVDNVASVAFCNLVGGQDELVFDGNSAIVDARGDYIARGRQFEEDLIVVDVELDGVGRQRLHDPRRRKEQLNWPEDRIKVVELKGATDQPKPTLAERQVAPLGPVEEVYRALVVGTGDYVRKNGFSKVVIGLSGGVDSSLTAAVAADALGAENVTGVFMPSKYSSDDSQEDAQALAENLGIHFMTVPIVETVSAYGDMLADAFAGAEPNVAEENIQARIRGNVLMALSNKYGWLVLTTGNKSEMAVGYATLYGDMAGGFAVIKDVPKMLVYACCAYRNTVSHVVPQRVFDKAPTAELKPNQTDQDSLPPYDVLDGILHEYVEEDKSPAQIAEMGYSPAVVNEVIAMVDRNEYKRRQAAPGVKITPLAFGRDRRLPITNQFRDRVSEA
jgi:NAD+ synthase (glutamine-hydrolysing)